MVGWRDAVVSGAMAGPAFIGQIDVSSLADAAGAHSPVERSAAALLENTGDAISEHVKGQMDAENAANSDKIAEPEYGEYSDSERLEAIDDEGFEFEPVEHDDSGDYSDSVGDQIEDFDDAKGGWN